MLGSPLTAASRRWKSSPWLLHALSTKIEYLTDNHDPLMCAAVLLSCSVLTQDWKQVRSFCESTLGFLKINWKHNTGLYGVSMSFALILRKNLRMWIYSVFQEWKHTITLWWCGYKQNRLHIVLQCVVCPSVCLSICRLSVRPSTYVGVVGWSWSCRNWDLREDSGTRLVDGRCCGKWLFFMCNECRRSCVASLAIVQCHPTHLVHSSLFWINGELLWLEAVYFILPLLYL